MIVDSSAALLSPQTLSQVLWAISSAISVAFFTLSGIAAQLLNALGLDGEREYWSVLLELSLSLPVGGTSSFQGPDFSPAA